MDGLTEQNIIEIEINYLYKLVVGSVSIALPC